MKKFTIMAVALAFVLSASAQPVSTIPKNIRASNTLSNLYDANGVTNFDNFYGIPLEPGSIVGNAYLNPDWKRTAFLLYDNDKMIEGYSSRYEIDRDQFEILASGTVKVLHGKKVKSFVWVDSLTRIPHYFVNGSDFKDENNISLSGFYEVLTEGALSLLAKTEVVVKKSSYSVAFDMGNRDTRISKKTVFLYTENGKIKEVPSARKKLLPVFGQHASAVDRFIRVNTLSLTEAAHLKAVFEHHNSLMVTN
jgi:hypothetical protein